MNISTIQYKAATVSKGILVFLWVHALLTLMKGVDPLAYPSSTAMYMETNKETRSALDADAASVSVILSPCNTWRCLANVGFCCEPNELSLMN